METVTTTNVVLQSPDISITKTEIFDVEMGRQIVDDKNQPKEERDRLKRYLKNRVRGNQHDTTYKLGKYCKHEALGRFCALRGESLQCLGKDIRNALAGSFYWDLDMVNAQPTLLQQYAEKNGWKCENIKTYIEKREELLSEICETLNIERWEAKEKVISIFFGCGSGLVENLPSFFVDELYPEIRMIMKNNWEHNKAILKWLEKQPNHVGKGLADILQTEERKCLLALDRSLAKNGRSMDVFMHDGGLIRKKENETCFPKSLITQLEKDIEAETGYKLKLLVKEMKTSIIKETENDDYNERKKEFENKHFKLMNPPRYIRQNGSSFQYLTDHDLTFLYRNEMCSNGETFIDRWIKDPEILTYEQFEFKPMMETSKNCFNLFQGFAMKPVEGDWSIIRELLWDLSGRNQENFDYFINWSAHLFQKPFEKPEVVIILSSAQEGVGKDTYADHVLRPILGADYYFTTTDHENEIFNRFTSHLQNKLLIKMEEMNYDVMNRNDDKLKGWVTCETKSYEEKGVSKTPNIDSFHRFIGTTNEACPVKLTNTFRRYLLVNPYQGNAGNIAHWERVYREIKKPEVLQAYLHYLLSVDISNFNPRNKCETEALKEARQSQAPPHARFFENFIQSHQDKETASFFSQELLNRINDQSKFPYTPKKLSNELQIYPHTKTHTRSGNEYKFVLADVKKVLQDRSWWVDF